MGKKADELGRTLDANLGAMTSTSREFEAQVTDARGTARALGDLPERLGMGGLSGTAAAARLTSISAMAEELGARLAALQGAAESAERAVQAAQQDFHALPDGELSFGERAALTAAGTVVMPGLGTLGGMAAGDVISDRREAARERAATSALASLEAQVMGITLPSTTPRYSVTPIEDDIETPGTTGTDTGVNTRGGYAPTGGSAGPGASGVRVTDGAAGIVGSSWQPPTSTPVSTIGDDGGTGTGGTGPRVGDTWTNPGVGTGGSGSGSSGSGGGAGSGVGPGYVPGSGDGSSSDGLVGGTVPGSTGGGNSSGSFFGGSGGAGANGSGSGLGLGAGGLAGGLTVGGAALGGAGLNRLAGGGAGGMGGSGFGGVGMGGAGGSVPLGTIGAATPGASGSGLSGSTSGLGQGTQTGAAGAAASGARSGGMMGGPMGGGAGGAGGAGQSKRRGSSGLLAPIIEVEDGAQRPALGTGAGAGGRDALAAPVVARTETADDEW